MSVSASRSSPLTKRLSTRNASRNSAVFEPRSLARAGHDHGFHDAKHGIPYAKPNSIAPEGESQEDFALRAVAFYNVKR